MTTSTSETQETAQATATTAPALWVRSPVSTKTLMADGLTALLPYRDLSGSPAPSGNSTDFGSLGRTWFADQLLNRAPDIPAGIETLIRAKTLTWDLEGL
jgi:hypothetical protein